MLYEQYAKMVVKETGEVFAYFQRGDFDVPEPMNLWIGAVFYTWTISREEFETYGKAFGVAPVIDLTDFAVIGIDKVYKTRSYSDIESGRHRSPYQTLEPRGDVWYWEIKRDERYDDEHA